MSIQEWYASECELCHGYSNSGFDLCKECAFGFALWLKNEHTGKVSTVEEVEKLYDEYKQRRAEERDAILRR